MTDIVWLPYAGHFNNGGHLCRFRLNTYVNGYIISTLGEYVPDGKDDYGWDAEEDDYGWVEIGYQRTFYETRVFRAMRSQSGHCPYRAKDSAELELCGYNNADDAYGGHLALIKKWSKKEGAP